MWHCLVAYLNSSLLHMHGELGATYTTLYHQHSSTTESMSTYIAFSLAIYKHKIFCSLRRCVRVKPIKKSNIIQLWTVLFFLPWFTWEVIIYCSSIWLIWLYNMLLGPCVWSVVRRRNGCSMCRHLLLLLQWCHLLNCSWSSWNIALQTVWYSNSFLGSCISHSFKNPHEENVRWQVVYFHVYKDAAFRAS